LDPVLLAVTVGDCVVDLTSVSVGVCVRVPVVDPVVLPDPVIVGLRVCVTVADWEEVDVIVLDRVPVIVCERVVVPDRV
jgi:hypothetical protein